MAEYTLSYRDRVYNCESGNTLGKGGDAIVVDIPDCAISAYMGIHSECQEVRSHSAKLISKLLNS